MPKVYSLFPLPMEPTEPVKNKIVVVIDVIRASTTIAAAFARGYKYIVPISDIDAAFQLREKLNAILAGEKDGIKVPGFDFSNSPYEILNSPRKRDILILRTTNGVRAISYVKGKGNLITTCGLVNISSVAELVSILAKETRKDILVLAVGRKGVRGIEDEFCAGLLVEKLRQKNYELSNESYKLIEIAKNCDIEKCVFRSSWALELLKIEKNRLNDLKLASKIDYFAAQPLLTRIELNGIPLEAFIDYHKNETKIL
ncbi:MAG: 2-phosphosulfolactate phosphatase [Candidatus Njordarchaeum guaymaensis]